MLACRFLLDPIWWLFVSRLPIYLAETFGFDIKQIGLFAWVPFVGAMLGSLSGGWLSGRMIRAGHSVDRARKLSITLGCVVMAPALLGAVLANQPLLAVLAIAAVLFGFRWPSATSRPCRATFSTAARWARWQAWVAWPPWPAP